MPSRPLSPGSETPVSSSDAESQNGAQVARSKGKGKALEAASKRKRTLTNSDHPSSARRRTREPQVIDDDDGAQLEFDPDQSLEERRKVRGGFRSLLRDLTENGDEFLQPNSHGLHQTLRQANELSRQVKQTTEATIDSKLLVNTANASLRKANRLTSGNIAQGLDVDDFVSKCITYMRLGRGITQDDAPELTLTQAQRRRPAGGGLSNGDDYEDIGDDGDALNWTHLGQFACLPNIKRPAVPGFLLGPLSVEKKARRIAKRSAPFRPGNLEETRPQVLNSEDIERAENNDVTAICAKIFERLTKVQDQVQRQVESVVDRPGSSDEEAQKLMAQLGLRSTGGIDLLKFVVNPRSFGQTVENLFYVSFLIRDGRVQVEFDDDGLPSLCES
ncbi:Nse4-domain-containing protein [Xylariaceae sp. FL0804]|nr:Nse4-domain-containing protein [Xylariaceae sp. FL0804]